MEKNLEQQIVAIREEFDKAQAFTMDLAKKLTIEVNLRVSTARQLHKIYQRLCVWHGYPPTKPEIGAIKDAVYQLFMIVSEDGDGYCQKCFLNLVSDPDETCSECQAAEADYREER